MSKLTYTGRALCVKIGNQWVEPGDVVTDKKPKGGEIRTDPESLERLSWRSDFEEETKRARAVLGDESFEPETGTEVV